MHVQQLTAYKVCIPLKKKIKHASHTRDENETLLIRCELDNGIVGWGEGLPRPYVTGETIDSAFDQLKNTDLLGQLTVDVDDLSNAISVIESIQLEAVPENKRDCFGNSVRCAIEIAYLDAVTRSLELPLSAVVTHLECTEPIRQQVERVRYSGAITPMGWHKEMYRALKLRYYQFHQTKVKVGVDGLSDVAALRRIRWVLGRNVDIRIDANEAWTCENLEQKLAVLTRFGITACEQPVPHDDVAGLARIKPNLNVPLMLDESLCSLSDGERAIDQKTCDLFNIRLSKCGGIVNSLRLAAMAHNAGMGYQLGCQVGETGILSAAGRHFASSIKDIRYLEGSYDRFLVAEPLTIEDLTFGRGGYAPTLSGPGLGITIDQQAVDRTTVKQMEWKS